LLALKRQENERMPTRTDTTVVPFADLLETSTRVISASAELYTEVLRTQADAARDLIEAYAGLGGQAVTTTAQRSERAEEAVAEVARGTGQAARRATRRTASATRTAARRTRRVAKAATPVKAAKAALEAPIAGYDDLTAEDVVAKLPEQPQATLALVAAYEQANQKRTTVLERVAALTGPEPAPGYDGLTADEAQKLVTAGDAALAAAVRDYERRHKGRASVLDAAERNAEQS
jgi:hypothetical protein